MEHRRVAFLRTNIRVVYLEFEVPLVVQSSLYQLNAAMFRLYIDER